MNKGRTAGLYVRISDDRVGDSAGVARQEADCRELVKRWGWDVGQVYVENDVSAFKRKKVQLPDGTHAMRVIRPAFRQLLDDLASGAVDALVAYDLDRIARDPRDLEDLIDVVEPGKVPTRSVTGSLDLSNDSGVTMARVMVALANKSSRDTARRTARKHLQLAQEGKTGGGGLRPYGYDASGREVIEGEAKLIREIAERILAGDSLNSIAEDLNVRQVPTVKLGKWGPRSVHSVVTKARVAGLREHLGEIVAKADWEPILDEDTWTRVRMNLANRSAGAGNVLKRWLAGILLCNACGFAMVGWGNVGGKKKYWCATPRGGCGGTSIGAEVTETYVETLILAYLARPDVLASLQVSSSSEATGAARVALATDEDQLGELAHLWSSRQITTKEYMSARGPIEARIADHQLMLKRSLPGTVRTLVTSEDLSAAWRDLAPVQRREVARVVFDGGIIVGPHVATAARVVDTTRLQPVGWGMLTAEDGGIK